MSSGVGKSKLRTQLETRDFRAMKQEQPEQQSTTVSLEGPKERRLLDLPRSEWLKIILPCVLTFLLGIIGSQFLQWLTTKEPHLYYKVSDVVPFKGEIKGEKSQIGIINISLDNDGTKEARNVQETLVLHGAKVQGIKISPDHLNGSHHETEERVEINVPLLNPGETVKLSIFASNIEQLPVAPPIVVRAEGIQGENIPINNTFKTWLNAISSALFVVVVMSFGFWQGLKTYRLLAKAKKSLNETEKLLSDAKIAAEGVANRSSLVSSQLDRLVDAQQALAREEESLKEKQASIASLKDEVEKQMKETRKLNEEAKIRSEEAREEERRSRQILSDIRNQQIDDLMGSNLGRRLVIPLLRLVKPNQRFNINEIAENLNISDNTIRAWIRLLGKYNNKTIGFRVLERHEGGLYSINETVFAELSQHIPENFEEL
jgi:hypothetical protein